MLPPTPSIQPRGLMPAIVHAGAQGRWHEELCRIRVTRLRDVITSDRMTLVPPALPAKGGVYCFWWTGSLDLLRNDCNRQVELVGPAKQPVLLHFDDEWLGLATNLPIPFYVGKTADSIAQGSALICSLVDRESLAFLRGTANRSVQQPAARHGPVSNTSSPMSRTHALSSSTISDCRGWSSTAMSTLRIAFI